MTKLLDENIIRVFDEEEHETAPLAHLVELGREQGFVTLDDILHIFPEVENDMDRLEEAFSTLLTAGIAYIDDPQNLEPVDDELQAEEDESEKLLDQSEDDFLSHIDVDDTIGLYIKEASRIPLLNAQEEMDLAKRIERGRLAREELVLGNINVHRRNELHRISQDAWRAREHLIVANSRLVISVAKKYMYRGVPFLDLIQEGNIGLMRAAKKFDYHRGFKFSTYATWWIRQAVTRAIADQSRTIRVPVHMGDQISKMLRIQHQLKQTLGRDPTTQELAVELDVPPKKVEHMLQVARRPISLQTPIGEEEDEVLGDFIEDQDSPPPDETASQQLLREQLEKLLEMLPPREARILQLRYGLVDGQVLTLNEVGRKMGVTRERVRQIEAQALNRLRSFGIQRQLRAYIE